LREYDEAEHHSIHVNASPEQTYQSMLVTPLGSSPIVRALIRLRDLPSAVLGKSCDSPNRETGTILDMIGNGFFLVDEHAGREIVIGTIGRFWSLRGGGTANATAEDLQHPLPPGTAVALWNFRVVRKAPGAILHTETRIKCADDSARRSFRRYWMFVAPFSALIRKKILESVKYEAESEPAALRSS
jgi:hypothetical protein